MSTNNPDNAMNRLYRTRWFMPAFCVLLAALMFAAFAIGGDAASGAYSAAVLLFVGAVFYFGARRSETLAGLGGPGRDERWERIDVHATALTGMRADPRDHRRLAGRDRAGQGRQPVRGSSARSAGSRTSSPSRSCAGAPRAGL